MNESVQFCVFDTVYFFFAEMSRTHFTVQFFGPPSVRFSCNSVKRSIPKLRIRRLGLGEKDGAAEENDADEEEEDEKAKLTHAGADRLAEDLQTLRMT